MMTEKDRLKKQLEILSLEEQIIDIRAALAKDDLERGPTIEQKRASIDDFTTIAKSEIAAQMKDLQNRIDKEK
jgi:hypothetical protein